jgi:hypothetical protein
MKQVLYLEAVKVAGNDTVVQLEDLLETLETSHHWMDFKSRVQHILANESREEKNLLDDFEILSLLQDRIAALQMGDSNDPANN